MTDKPLDSKHYNPYLLLTNLTLNHWFDLLLRLGNALLVGAIVGLEREFQEKPAGLRTHMLVSLGCAAFVLIPIASGIVQESPDALSRVIQGVASGIGFIGAGEILQQSRSRHKGVRIRGLTSAAAIWVSATLGVAAGCGLWQLSLMVMGLTVIVLKLVKRLEPSD